MVDWVAVVDKSSSRLYYYSPKSRQARWLKPESDSVLYSPEAKSLLSSTTSLSSPPPPSSCSPSAPQSKLSIDLSHKIKAAFFKSSIGQIGSLMSLFLSQLEERSLPEIQCFSGTFYSHWNAWLKRCSPSLTLQFISRFLEFSFSLACSLISCIDNAEINTDFHSPPPENISYVITLFQSVLNLLKQLYSADLFTLFCQGQLHLSDSLSINTLQIPSNSILGRFLSCFVSCICCCNDNSEFNSIASQLIKLIFIKIDSQWTGALFSKIFVDFIVDCCLESFLDQKTAIMNLFELVDCDFSINFDGFDSLISLVCELQLNSNPHDSADLNRTPSICSPLRPSTFSPTLSLSPRPPPLVENCFHSFVHRNSTEGVINQLTLVDSFSLATTGRLSDDLLLGMCPASGTFFDLKSLVIFVSENESNTYSLPSYTNCAKVSIPNPVVPVSRILLTRSKSNVTSPSFSDLDIVYIKPTHKLKANLEFFSHLNSVLPKTSTTKRLVILSFLLDPSTDSPSAAIGLRSAHSMVKLSKKWEEGLRKSFKQYRKQTWIRECNVAKKEGSTLPKKPADNENPQMTDFEEDLLSLLVDLEVELSKFKEFVLNQECFLDRVFNGEYSDCLA
ncbi:hypothetical protein P9112_002746 [Eukaryota sp. TZLM1-RC]